MLMAPGLTITPARSFVGAERDPQSAATAETEDPRGRAAAAEGAGAEGPGVGQAEGGCPEVCLASVGGRGLPGYPGHVSTHVPTVCYVCSLHGCLSLCLHACVFAWSLCVRESESKRDLLPTCRNPPGSSQLCAPHRGSRICSPEHSGTPHIPTDLCLRKSLLSF